MKRRYSVGWWKKETKAGVTIATDDGLALYDGTLAELLDKMQEELGEFEPYERDYLIFEYVAGIYRLEQKIDSWDEYIKSVQEVMLKDGMETGEIVEVDDTKAAELKAGIEELKRQAEELLPGVRRIAKAVSTATVVLEKKFAKEFSGMLMKAMAGAGGVLEGDEDVTAEQMALLMGDPKGEA
jgi:hypothetical protein